MPYLYKAMTLQTRYTPLNAFLAYLQFEKRYSLHTITAYSNDLIQFFDFVETQFEGLGFDQITGTMVRSWLAGMKEEQIWQLSDFSKVQLKDG